MKKAIVLILFFATNSLWAQEAPSGNPATPESAAAPAASDAPDKPIPTEPAENEREWRFALGLGYSFGSKLKFTDGKTTSSGQTLKVTAEYDYKEAFHLDFQARYLPVQDWGMTAGIQFDGEREFDGGSMTIDGTTFNVSSGSGPSKIQVTNLYMNAAYRWDQFYIPFGVNASIVKFTPADGFSGTYQASGGVGAQLGVGVQAHRNFAVELFSRAIAVKLESTTNGTTTDYGNGFLSSATIQGKYIF